MGDPARALQAAQIIRIIEANDLVTHTREMGVDLFAALRDMSGRYPSLLQNLRGKDRGTFIAFDCETPAKRDELVARLRNKGVLVGGSGERAVRLRPLLIFGSKEMEVLVETLEAVCKEMVV